jgi:hypothetical protein
VLRPWEKAYWKFAGAGHYPQPLIHYLSVVHLLREECGWFAAEFEERHGSWLGGKDGVMVADRLEEY